MRVGLWFCLVFGGGIAVVASCSASNSSNHVVAKGGAAGAIGIGGGGSGGAIGVDGSCQELTHCSADLKSVLDCYGNVVETCPDDQGCLNGVCGGNPCANASQTKTSVGCDYYAVDPDILTDAKGGCYAAFVVNTWNEPVTLTVDYGGQVLDPNLFTYLPKGTGPSITYEPISGSQIPAGEVAILFLNRKGFNPPGLNTNCPAGVGKAISDVDAAKHGTGYGSAFHIATTAPVAAYDIYPYGGGQSALTSATLLLPTTSWGDNYIAVNAFGAGLPMGSQPFVEIVGLADGTTVTINPVVNIVGGGAVAAAAKGAAASYTVNKGQVLQFTQAAALQGSVIQSSQPVGVWGGATALGIEACCDESAHQQIPPVRSLGNEYVGVRYRNRYDGIEETPPWRMIGAVDGTALTWEPDVPPGAPTALAQGQMVKFNASGPFVVRSQDADHPFYMSAHMTGAALYDPSQQDGGTSSVQDGRGDAEFVNVIPPGEYLEKYIFFSDPTYSETNLVLVRVKGPGGFEDVSIDCASGPITGWQPVGASGNYEYTRFDLVRYNFEPQNGCDNGRHEISSKQPFGLTVWGWGSPDTGSQASGFYTQYVSYAYPGGAGVAPINTVVVPPVK